MRGCLCTLFGTESRTSQMARPIPLDLTVSNIRCHGISVEDCATTEILVCLFDAISGPGTVPGPEIASNRQTSISVMTTEPIKIPLKVAFSALILSKSASLTRSQSCAPSHPSLSSSLSAPCRVSLESEQSACGLHELRNK